MPALLAVTVWGSKTGWPLAVMILSLAYLGEAGVMLTWPTLRSRADFDHVAVGTECLLVGRRSCCSGSGSCRTDGNWWASHFCSSGSPPCWAVLWPCWTDGPWWGVALLLSPVTALLLGVAFLLDSWARLESPSCWARSPPRLAIARAG
jgi:hypothetical protein